MLLVVAACTCAFRFAFVLLFEHVVFVFKYLLNLVIHDMPADVEIKVRREEYRVSPHEAQSGVRSERGIRLSNAHPSSEVHSWGSNGQDASPPPP